MVRIHPVSLINLSSEATPYALHRLTTRTAAVGDTRDLQAGGSTGSAVMQPDAPGQPTQEPRAIDMFTSFMTRTRYALGDHQNWQSRVGWKNRYQKVLDHSQPYHLGEGVFGKVVHMRDVRSGQHVAIKKIHHESQSFSVSEATTFEYAQGRAVQSPYVVSPLAMALDPCKPRGYIVFPLIGGTTVERTSRLTKVLLKQVFADVLVGLQHCHDGGIAHGDLAERNIMVENGRDRIIDLGYCYSDPFEIVRKLDVKQSLAALGRVWQWDTAELDSLSECLRETAQEQKVHASPGLLLANPFFDGFRQTDMGESFRAPFKIDRW